MELYARCAGSFEDVLAAELRDLHMGRVRAQVGGVSFTGRLPDAYRACLWSRVATRVQLVLGRVPCTTADELYTGIYDISWEEHVRDGATIAVRAHGTNGALRNTAFTALKAKDAVCDQLRVKTGKRPDVDAHDPDLEIDLAVHERKATVYLNLSGASLHRRGYREDGVQTVAPLKETLAAGMLMFAGWPEIARRGGVLADPMCGSGTIAIEAALMACGIAPGVRRERWGFESWVGHDAGLWAHILEDATERACRPQTHALVLAGDVDESALAIARENVRRAGVGSQVQLFHDDAARLGRHLRGVLKRGARPGLLAANPPYGQRLGTSGDVVQAHRALAEAVESLPDDWGIVLITPNVSVDTALGRVPEASIECHNGPLEVSVRRYARAGERKTCEVVSLAGVHKKVTVADDHSAQFAARLRKVARERMRAARREGSTCARLYNADMPDFPVVIDWYEDVGAGTAEVEDSGHVTVEEARRARKKRSEQAGRKLADACALVAAIADVPATNVHLRVRGDGRSHEEEVPLLVKERGLLFAVELLGEPDTGLDFSQDDLRERMGKDARGKRFLNVGGGASAATVCAAAGGASRTVTVEPFEDRADLMRRSLAANGLAGKRHRVVCADSRSWLERAQREKQVFDLVLCALPGWVGEADRRQIEALARQVVARGGEVVLV